MGIYQERQPLPKSVTSSAMITADPLAAALTRARERRRPPPPAARRMIRERAGLTQGDIAGALGVTREAVSHWKRGARAPRPAVAGAYVAVLDRLAREWLSS
jgi:DNA-binding transcriptional regulator YiaG